MKCQTSPSLRGLLVALVVTWTAGCTGTRYLPEGGQLVQTVAPPQELGGFDGAPEVAFDLPGGMASPDVRRYPTELATSELQGWFAAPGDDITLDLRFENMKDSGGWTVLFPYLVTLGFLPASLTSEGETVLEVKAGNEVLYQSRQPVTYRTALSVFLPTAYALGSPGKSQYAAMVADQLNRHKLAMGHYIAGQKADYEAAVAAGTVDAYRGYLAANPESFFRMETLRRLAALAPPTGALAFHRDNLALDTAYMLYLPDAYDVWFVGPEGMRVHDVLRLSREQEEVLLASRIKAAGQPYKVFDNDEISLLREGGISATLIAAMIDASAGAAASGPEPGPGPAPAVVMPVAGAAPVAGESAAAPGAADIAAQCAKRYAALKACDQVPSFGANLCRSKVKKTYNHLACELIQ
ncbi:MAG: hypothetical protein P1U64_04355 [Alcanivoracaceae bacterium]|nr:hypothetical protein [Alcanivoracaceae bacterium]